MPLALTASSTNCFKATVFKRGPKGPLTGATIRFHGDNRFTINASIDQFLLPKNVSIDGAFAPTTDFAKDPRLLILLAPSTILGIILKGRLRDG